MLLPYMETGRIEAGCDEAGRGCLAGAVFAAAVHHLLLVLSSNVRRSLGR